MISVDLENNHKSEKSSYKDRYMCIYVCTTDFAVAAKVAIKHAGNKFTVSSMSLTSSTTLDISGNPL